MSSSSNASPFPWGIGWRAFFLGWSTGDRIKFENTMEVCSNFSSMPYMQKEYYAVIVRAIAQELKTLIPNPAKGAMAIDIIRWAMNQAIFDDAKQRKRWSKYKNYWAPNDCRAAVYWETAIVPSAVIGGEPEEEEEPVQMPVRAPEAGRRSWQIDLDSVEDDDDRPPSRRWTRR
ncbi:Chitinase domain-containing protein 1 [Hordeum vulgare]|nr:Chitinase domain-containing protein 1 [Hordeum vulgare]